MILPLLTINDFETHDEFRIYMKKRRIQIANYLWRNKSYYNDNGKINKDCKVNEPIKKI